MDPNPGKIARVATLADRLDAPAPAPAPASTKRRRRHPVLMWLAGFLVVFLGAELAVRVVGNQLPEPLRYFSGHAQIFVHDMDTLRDAGVESELTFVGTSMVRRDVDANQLEPLVGMKWVHNLALPGAQTPVVERWLLEEVLPRIHPKRVVWGISSLDFNAGRPDHVIDEYNAARQTKQGFYAELDRMMELSALSEHREALRDPLSVQRVVEGNGRSYKETRKLQDRAVWKLGYPPSTPQQIERGRANHLRTVRDKQLANFRIGTQEMRAYLDTLRELRRQGIDAAVVLMPVTTGYIDAHPHGAADFNAWKAVVTEAARSVGVPVVDLSNAMPDDAFRDYEHLFVGPAHEFTTRIAAELEQLGWSKS
jgi:hypothetical protein